MKKNSAFTLIELLVVIAIIAVLASIALPVFQSTMEKSRATQDLANLRQLGMAIQAYLTDRDDKMFDSTASGTGSSNPTGTATTYVWPQELHPKYIGTYKVFQSPFDRRPASEVDPAPVSYGMNPNVFAGIAGSTSTYNGYSSQFQSPSVLILLAPTSGGKTPTFTTTSAQNIKLTVPGGSTSNQGVYDGGSRQTVLFADFHSASMSWRDYADQTAPNNSHLQWNPVFP